MENFNATLVRHGYLLFDVGYSKLAKRQEYQPKPLLLIFHNFETVTCKFFIVN
jgi:hypothetical protein